MNVGIIGNNLTSLTLAKALVNKKVNVTLFYKQNEKLVKSNRSIGITLKNLSFFNKKIFKIDKKFFKSIKEISIYFENSLKKETLNFKKDDLNLLNMIKVQDIFSILNIKLNQDKLFNKKKINKKNFYDLIENDKKYDLIFNCEKNNNLTKKYFYQNFKKDYKSKAITCSLFHKKKVNNKASQIFTKYGPLAFLPIKNNQTSIVFSIYSKNKKLSDNEILKIINFYNKNYKINKISELEKVDLKFSAPRKYYLGKILLFGDILHQIHPLAGQGFNMTLRDLEILLNLIQKKIDLGLHLDETINSEFEKKVKHFNFIYSNSINLLHDFFKFDSSYQNDFSHRILNLMSKNKNINNFFIKAANQGISIY